MPIPRRDLDRFTPDVVQLMQIEVEVALGCHQLHVIAQAKPILHLHFRQPLTSLAGQFTDELLPLRHRAAVLVVLVLVMHMPTQKAFGVAALSKGFEVGHQAAVEIAAGHGIIDGPSVDLGGPRTIEMRFGPAFDFQ